MTTIVIRNGVVYSDTKTTAALGTKEDTRKNTLNFLEQYAGTRFCETLRRGVANSQIWTPDLHSTVDQKGKVTILDSNQYLEVDGSTVKVAAYAGDLIVGAITEELLRYKDINDIETFCSVLGSLEEERMDIINDILNAIECSTLERAMARHSMKENTFFTVAFSLADKRTVVVYRKSVDDIGVYEYRIYNANETVAIGSGATVQPGIKLLAKDRGWIKGEVDVSKTDITTWFKQSDKLSPLATFLLGAGIDKMSNWKLRITRVDGKPWWKFW